MSCCQNCTSGLPCLSISGVDGGECDAPVKFPWPSDVDNLKARIHAQVQALDLAVEENCGGLSPADKQSWNDFLAQWIPFVQKKTPIIGAYGEWVTACGYAHTVDAWRDKLAKVCSNLPGPEPVKGADTTTVTAVTGAIKALAVVVAVVGGVYVLSASGVLSVAGRLTKRSA